MKSVTPQAEIDELLNSGDSSLMRQLRVSKAAEQRRKSEAPSEDYEQEFDEYEETRKLETVSYRSDFHAESNPEWKKTKTVLPAGKENQIQESIAAVEESIPKTEFEESRMSKTAGQPASSIGKTLHVIKEQPSKQRRSSREIKPPRPSQSTNKYLPYNFAKLRDTEKERLFTSLYDDLTQCKQEINDLKEQLKNTNCKYNALLQKTPQVERAKEDTLLKENSVLKQKVDSLLQIKKKFDDQNSFARLSRTQTSSPFSQQQQAANAKEYAPVSEREQELLKFIDQLKGRLKDSEANLKSLQAKMNEGLDFQQHFKDKVRMVESLEYKLAKLSEQAEADRLLIEQLKLKVQESNEKLAQQRQKNARIEKEFRRVELSIATNNDLAKDLQQVRKEKERLEKSLRDITGSLVSRVTEKNKEAQKKLQPFGHIDVLDIT